MAKYIDMHIHLTNEKYKDDLEEVIQDDQMSGVKKVVLIGCDEEEILKSIELAKKYEDYMYLAIGFHPMDVKYLNEDKISWLEHLIIENKQIIAVGEIGLDYYWYPKEKDLQEKYFRIQIRLAKKLNLPIIVHSRDAGEDCFKIIQEEDYFYGIMHSYADGVEIAQKYVNNGMFLSISGPLTFKNGHNQKEVVKNIDLNRLLVETDGPFLTPVPYRGKTNRSKYIKYIIEEIARQKELTIEEVEDQIYKNATSFIKGAKSNETKA